MAQQTEGTMSVTKDAARRRLPSKHQRTKAEAEKVIVIDTTLTSWRAMRRAWSS